MAQQLGEINDVPESMRTSLAQSGIYGPLFPQAFGDPESEVLAGVIRAMEKMELPVSRLARSQ